MITAVIGDEAAHEFVAALVNGIGARLLVPDPVVVEVDIFLRSRGEHRAARIFLSEIAAGAHRRVPMTNALLARALAFDARYADLGLGFVDTSVMAVAEAEGAPILTFDFRHFRAAPRERSRAWDLLVDEAALRRAIGR